MFARKKGRGKEGWKKVPENPGLRAHKTVNPSPVYISGCTAAVNFLSAHYCFCSF
jgi:hypothetical protein